MAKDAITLFQEAAKQLQQEMEFVALEGARKLNDEDEALQDMIGAFNLARMDLNSEISKTEGKEQEKIAELNTKVGELYNAIMENESMKAHNEAKAEFEAVVNHINAIVNTAANGGDPMTVEEPPAGGCGGSCSSCSGCH